MTKYSTLGLRGFGLALVFCSMALAADPAPSAAPPSGGAGTGSGAVGAAAAVSDAFGRIQTPSLTSAYASCKGAAWIGAAGTTVACINSPPGDIKDASKNLSCEALSSSGSFSFDLATRRQKEFEDMIKGVDCEKSKLDAARGQLQCLSDQAGALAAQIGAMSKDFKDNLTRAKGDISQINSQIVDRKEQQKDLISKIGGDGETGDDGLLGAKKSTEELLSKIQGDLLVIKNNNRALDNKRAEFLEQVQSRTVVLARECFATRSDANFRCTKNGPPVKLRDYILCRYEQNQFVGEGGVVEDNKLNQVRAGGNRAALEQLLDEMFSEAPRNKDVPMSSEQLQAAATQPVGVLSYKDIEARYGPRFDRFNGKGLDIRGFVFSNAKSCFDRAETTVARERKLKGSQLGVAQEMILAKERENQANTMSKFQDYNQVYTKALGSITQQNLPLVLTACERGKPAQQEGCFDQIEKSVRGLLMGNAPGSSVKMVIHGTNPANNFNVTCSGINGCLKALQNRNKSLKVEIAKVKEAKRIYVTKFNDSAERFTQRMAQSLGVQNQALDQQMRSLNATLAGLGVKGVVDLKPIDAEEFEHDGEVSGDNDTDMGGLYKMPKNLLKLVGGKMTPPMLNVAENSFKEALEGVAERKKDLDDRKAQAREAADKLASMMSECPGKEKEKIAEKLGGSLEKLAQCSRALTFCQSNGPTALEALRDSLRSLELTADDADISGTLGRGISDCRDVNNTFNRITDEADKAKAKLEGNPTVDCQGVVSDIRSKASAISSINRRVKKATAGSAN